MHRARNSVDKKILKLAQCNFSAIQHFSSLTKGGLMTTREFVYAMLAALGVIVPLYYNLQYMSAGGNLLVDFFTVPLQNAVTASLLFDILIAFVAFNVLLFAEGRTLGSRNFIICVAVSWLVAFAAGLPLFLLLRERQQRLGH
jgi:hypothetical protein